MSQHTSILYVAYLFCPDKPVYLKQGQIYTLTYIFAVKLNDRKETTSYLIALY